MAKARIEIDFDASGLVTGLKVSGKQIDVFGKQVAGSKAGILNWGRILDNTMANLASGAIRRLTRGFGDLVRFGIRTLNDSVKLAGIQQIAENKLSQAIANTGAATEEWLPRLKAVAAEVQNLSNFGDEQIITAQALLLSFKEVSGPEGAEILTKRLADVAAGLAKSSGQAVDLNTVAQAVGRSLTAGAGALSRYGISMSEAEKAAFNAAKGLERVNILATVLDNNFKGLAEATVDPIKQLENAVGDLQESLAEELRPQINELAGEVRAFIQDPSIHDAARAIGRAIVSSIKGIIRFLGTMRIAYAELGVTLTETGILVTGFFRDLLELEAKFLRATSFIPGFLQAAEHLDDVAADLRLMNFGFELALENQKELRTEATLAMIRLLAAGDAAKGYAGSLGGGGSEDDGSVAGSSKKAKTMIGELNDELKALQATFNELATTDPTKIFDLEDQIKRAKEQLQEVRLQMQLLRAITRPEAVKLAGPDVGTEDDLQRKVERTSEGVHAAAKRATERSREIREADAEAAKESFEDMLSTASDVAGNISDVFGLAFEATGQESKTLFGIFKAVSIAEALISTFSAVNKALPNYILAGAVLATGLANVAKIASTQPGGSTRGGASLQEPPPANRTGGESARFPLALGAASFPLVPQSATGIGSSGTEGAFSVELIQPRQRIEGDTLVLWYDRATIKQKRTLGREDSI